MYLIPVMLSLPDMTSRVKIGFQETFEHFDEVIGLKYLKGMHLNDSKKGKVLMSIGTRCSGKANWV